MAVDRTLGNSLAHTRITFGVMNSHDSIFVAPPITEVPDYVWAPRYNKPCFIPGRPIQKAKEEGRRISHPDAESALKAAKRACRANPGRWFGRSSSQADGAEFLVYEGGKVIERHVVSR